MGIKPGYKGMVMLACEDPLPFSQESATADSSGLIWQIDDVDMRLWSPTEGNIVVEVSSDGVEWAIAPVNSYSIRYAGGKVRFYENEHNYVRLYGYYLTASENALAKEWTFGAGPEPKPAPVFGKSWVVHKGTPGKTTATISQWKADDWFFNNLGNLVVLQLYEDRDTGARYELVGRLSKNSIKAVFDGLIEEPLEFEGYGEPNYEAT